MWVEHHPHRVLPLYLPDRQTRVVGGDGAAPDDHSVDERSQPVQATDVGRPRDVVGLSALGRDPPIQTLPDLPDHEIRVELQRQVQVEEGARRVFHLARRGPPSRGIDLQPHIGIAMMVHLSGGGLSGATQGNGSDQAPGGAFVDRVVQRMVL